MLTKTDTNTVISIKNVSKAFKIYKDRPLTLKERLLRLRSNDYTPFYALKDISFEIKKGEVIGLIGHNGCGKSTLLSLIAGILYPDTGSIEVKGRISSLIELGAGFHPDFTGRENIYTNAAIFGMSKKRIDTQIDSIIDFSELGEFIENPVRTYSSGMYLKLAFSVAIHINPEILLVDEILAVGDMNFQKKCFEKMMEFKAKKITIVIVTHDLGVIERFCDRALWIHNGIIKKDSIPQDVVKAYSNMMEEKYIKAQEESNRQKANKEAITLESVDKSIEEAQITSPSEIPPECTKLLSTPEEVELIEKCEPAQPIDNKTKNVVITKVRMLDESKQNETKFQVGAKAYILLNYTVNKDTEKLGFGINFFSSDGKNCYATNSLLTKNEIKFAKAGNTGEALFEIERLNLIEGNYWFDASALTHNEIIFDQQAKIFSFSTFSDIKEYGVARIDHKWELNLTEIT